MQSEELVIMALIAMPALIGAVALAAGIAFLRRAKESKSSLLLNVIGGVCLTVALGIGSCYAVVFLS